MGLPHITRFLCCMGIEAGSRLVAFLHLVTSLVLLVLVSKFASEVGAQAGTVEDAGDHVYSTWYAIAVAVAVLTVVHVLLAVSLLYSIYKRNTRGLLVWVCVMCALVVASLLYIVVSLAVSGPSDTGSDIFITFIDGFAFYSFVCYCIMCVYSYYLKLRCSEEIEGPKDGC